MNKIPTAKEYIKDLLYTTRDEEEDVHDTLINVENAMIEFAKIHVETALNELKDFANNRSGLIKITDITQNDINSVYPLYQIK